MSHFLLPDEAYPPILSDADRERCDAYMRENIELVPTEPGRYFDRQGTPWVRNRNDSWTDGKGETRGPEWTPCLVLFGPFTAAD